MDSGINLSILTREAEAFNSIIPYKPKSYLPEIHDAGSMAVRDPSTISKDFDDLRFGAAALQQLNTSEHSLSSRQSLSPCSLLIASPYNEPNHYLDLKALDQQNRIFAKALTALRPIRLDYATAAYTESLNFDTVLKFVRSIAETELVRFKEHSFYVVIFRSKLKAKIDNDLLYKLDFESHREACESGGLLKYWFGKPDDERQNLATCFWRSREDAHKGGLGPWHAEARAVGRKMYEHIRFSTHRFTILEGGKGFRFEDWKD